MGITNVGTITVDGPITVANTSVSFWDYSYMRFQHGVANTESVSTVLTGILGFYESATLQRGADYLTSNVISITAPRSSPQMNELRSTNYSCDVNSSTYTTKIYHQIPPSVSTDSGGNVFVIYGAGGVTVEGTNIGGQQSTIVEKYNPALERQWQVVTGTTGTDFYYKLVPDEQGGALVWIPNGIEDDSGYLIDIGSDGSKQWERHINFTLTYNLYVRSLQFTPNLTENKILIGFSLYNPTTFYTTDSILMEVLLKDPIAGEPVGNNFDQIVWQDHRTNRIGAGTVKDPAGGYLMVSGTSFGSSSNTVFTKYSSAGEILWAKRLGTLYEGYSSPSSSSLAGGPIITENGDIWFIEYDPKLIANVYPKKLILRKIDKDGNHILSRHIEMVGSSSDQTFIISGFMYDGKDILIMSNESWGSKGGSNDSRQLISHLFRAPVSTNHHDGEIIYRDDDGNAKITITNRSIENDTWTDYSNGTQGAGVNLSLFWRLSNLTDYVDVVDTTTAGIDASYVPTYDYKTTHLCYKSKFSIGPIPIDRSIRRLPEFFPLELATSSGSSANRYMLILRWTDNDTNFTPSDWDTVASGSNGYDSLSTTKHQKFAPTRLGGFITSGQRKILSSDADFQYGYASEIANSYRTHILKAAQFSSLGTSSISQTNLFYIPNTSTGEQRTAVSSGLSLNVNTNPGISDESIVVAYTPYDSSNIHLTPMQDVVSGTGSVNVTTAAHTRSASTGRIGLHTLPGSLGTVLAWEDRDGDYYVLRIASFDPDMNMRWSHTLERTKPVGTQSSTNYNNLFNGMKSTLPIGVNSDKDGNIVVTTQWHEPTGLEGRRLMTYKIGYDGVLLWKEGLTTGNNTYDIHGCSSDVDRNGNIYTAASLPSSSANKLMIIRRNSDGTLDKYWTLKIGGKQWAFYGSSLWKADRLIISNPQIVGCAYASSGGQAQDIVWVAFTGINTYDFPAHVISNLETYDARYRAKTYLLKIVATPFAIIVDKSYEISSFDPTNTQGIHATHFADGIYVGPYSTPYDGRMFAATLCASVTKYRNNSTSDATKLQQFPVMINMFDLPSGAQLAADDADLNLNITNEPIQNVNSSTPINNSSTSKPIERVDSYLTNDLTNTSYTPNYVSQVYIRKPEWNKITYPIVRQFTTPNLNNSSVDFPGTFPPGNYKTI